ncbi:uncharacterized protein si:dkey-60a16.1 [Danio aesculapii]|uniref:uncharacterized protein si:dkey-60a16.1 n=1 Tax=Danio aesculapii TaxID=1142201 RepID=UPI0024BFB481|nr:uncharacterized protein si:dkey-60a16.1 [Danio aesculapii]
MTCKRSKVTFQRRENSSVRFHCCVPQCTASSKFNSVLSFHAFPKDKDVQKKWVVNIRRDNFKVTQKKRVCSRHFRCSDLIEPLNLGGRRRLEKEAIPVLFHWNNFTVPAEQPGVLKGIKTDQLHDDDPSMDAIADHYHHDYIHTSAARDHTEDLLVEIASLQKQIEEISLSSRFCLERFAASDDDIRFYTRFATHAHLMAFWRLVEPAAGKVVTMSRAQAAANTDDLFDTAGAMSLQPIDEFFLFMTYLSLGLMQRDLAHRFRIHQSAVSRIINTWAKFLDMVLRAVEIWLDKKTVKAHMPEVFQHYSDTQVILYCAELRCQIPNPYQSDAFSTYKPQWTFKGLIGMAPHGAVTFVSSLYKGTISDREILKHSGIEAFVKPKMAIMVDEGFLVENCVSCKVHIPSVLSKRAQLSGSEIWKMQSLARLRRHVEHLIGRVKENKIFSTVIPLSLTGSVNQLYSVACHLVNYQNGSLVKNWPDTD